MHMLYHILMSNLRILPVAITSKQRIEAKIDSFRKDFLEQNGDLETVNMLIDVCIEYLSQFDDDLYLDQAFLKLGETGFLIDRYMYS
jgi:hypothetical protein